MDTQRDDARSFGAALSEARLAAGKPSYKQVERRVVEALGTYAPTDETIRNYHNGEVAPEKADLVLTCLLAEIYGARLGELSATVAQRMKVARDVLVRSSAWVTEADRLISA
jgi:hypothetical protein